MKSLERLIDRIIDSVNLNLREPDFDAKPYVRRVVPLRQFAKFYAFYGLTRHHRLHFHFSNSSLAGSYFLGKCIVEDSVLYKSDIRGDELKSKGDVFICDGMSIPLHHDEVIRIKDSYLIKTLVHNFSHDPEAPEEFGIQDTAGMHYANIHGSPSRGSFLGPFATVDLTTLQNCVIGPYAYVQAGELSHALIEAGRVWIRSKDGFEFSYRFPASVLSRYVSLEQGQPPTGMLMDFVEDRKDDFQKVFGQVHSKPVVPVPGGASLSRYAVVKGQTEIGENVWVAQRAFLENARLGRGANCQEHCYIVDSNLAGLNVTAHGGKIINADLGEKVFVGFNSFLRGSGKSRLSLGKGCIVMPHTIIDLSEPVSIPSDRLVWGHIRSGKDLLKNSIPLRELQKVRGSLKVGGMKFKGDGRRFVHSFQRRIDHILDVNGAYFDGKKGRGHAQKGQNISFNTIQPYPDGPDKGLYPTIDIRP